MIFRQAWWAILLLLCLPGAVQAVPLRVAVLLSEEGGAARELAEVLLQTRQSVAQLTVLRPGESLPAQSDLILAIGHKALSQALAQGAPVLAVQVSRAAWERLQQDEVQPRGGNRLSAIYLDVSHARQLDLLQRILPGKRRIGVLYAVPPSNLPELRQAAAARGLSLLERRLPDEDLLYRALHELLEQSEVLLALPDARVYSPSTLRNILLETYRQGVPVLGYSPAMVRAGALATVYTPPASLARQAMEMVEQFAVTGRLPAPQYAEAYDVLVNTQVARSLGLQLPDFATLRSGVKGSP